MSVVSRHSDTGKNWLLIIESLYMYIRLDNCLWEALKLAYQSIQLPYSIFVFCPRSLKLKTKFICVRSSFLLKLSFTQILLLWFIAYLRRAIAHQGQGLNQEAREDLSQVLAIEPNNKRAKVRIFFSFFFAGSTISSIDQYN